MKNTFNFLFLTMIALGSLMMISCGDDEPVMGCTDADADNYNADATESDNSCTYFDLFAGDYVGTFECAGALAQIFTAADVNISQSGAGVTALINSMALPGPVPLPGTITDKNTLSVDTTLPNVDLSMLIPGVIANIEVVGTLSPTADGISGPMSFNIVEVTGAVPPIMDSCTYTATKQ